MEIVSKRDDGRWNFTDPVSGQVFGPYNSETEARAMLCCYCEYNRHMNGRTGAISWQEKTLLVVLVAMGFAVLGSAVYGIYCLTKNLT